MDLNPTPQERQFRDELRAWLEAHAPRDWEARQSATDSMEARFAFLRDWQRQVYEAGWAGLSWPKEYGGRGATLMEKAIFTEEMARIGAPPLPGILGLELVGPTLIAFGAEAQKQRYLAKILSGEEIWYQGFSEPNAGSDLAALRTEATLDGDHFIVTGQKVWTSYGWASDWCELVVRTDAAAEKHKGLTVLLVDMHSAGVEVRPLRQMTGETEFNELFFDNVRVPVANVVGRVNNGWNVALSTLMHERALLGAGLQITFKRQFARLVELAHRIERNGRPAAEDPVIRQKLAQCYAEIEIMRLNQMRAISRVMETGKRSEGFHSEDLLERAESALPTGGHGAARPIRPIDARLRIRFRRRPVGLHLSAGARQHHRSRHLRDPAQYRRPLRPGIAQELLRLKSY
jgi:alkylation response protein AidB-like acyl-CoA dehydrogenase